VAALYLSTEGFDNPSATSSNFNNINNLFNPVLLPPILPTEVQEATQGINTTSQEYLGKAFEHTDALENTDMGVPAAVSEQLKIAQSVCEKVTTPNCNAFTDPQFNKYCGISFDQNGTNSKGTVTQGGLYINSKKASRNMADRKYSPTFGSSNQFAINQASCNYIRDDIACKQTKKPNEKTNCALCYNNGAAHAFDPATARPKPIKFVFYTNATDLTIRVLGGTSYTALSSSSTALASNVSKGEGGVSDLNKTALVKVTVPNVIIADGQTFTINAVSTTLNRNLFLTSGIAAGLLLGGYIEGPNQNGSSKFDLNTIIKSDNGQEIELGDSIENKWMLIQQQSGYPNITLEGILPFTFLQSPDSVNCPNSPFIASEAGAAYLLADEPCYYPNPDGPYGLECLQKLFKSVGGTIKGTLYPKTDADAANLNTKKFNPSNGKLESVSQQTLEQISSNLYQTSVLASTGMVNGQTVDILVWNAASQFMTGRRVAGACDIVNERQPVSNECRKELYKAQCLDLGTLNPDTTVNKTYKAPADLPTTKAALDAYYKNIKKMATSSTGQGRINPTIKPFMEQCFGIQLLQ